MADTTDYDIMSLEADDSSHRSPSDWEIWLFPARGAGDGGGRQMFGHRDVAGDPLGNPSGSGPTHRRPRRDSAGGRRRHSPEALVDLRDHALQRDFWWGTPEFALAYGALSINEIIARIGADLGVVGDFSKPVPLESRPRPGAEGLVLFVADADGTAKRWAPESWVDLARMLRLRGLDVAVSPATRAVTHWWNADGPVGGRHPG